jgi:hypothetical protein
MDASPAMVPAAVGCREQVPQLGVVANAWRLSGDILAEATVRQAEHDGSPGEGDTFCSDIIDT